MFGGFFMPVTIQQKHLEPLSHIEFIANQVVEGFITGLHKSPFHGFSVEFAEHRQYNKGESTRHIDWKLYARTDKLFVKRYEEETNLRCQLVIDHSSSMYFPYFYQNHDLNQLNKIGFSAYSAAVLINLLTRQLDAVGLTLFDSQIIYHTQAKSTKVHIKQLYNELNKLLQPKTIPVNQPSNIIKNLHHIAETIHKRSLVIVFSDLFDVKHNTNELIGALQHLKYNKHEVIVFQTLSKKWEYDFNWENRPYTFVDSETGEIVKLNPTQVKNDYLSKLHQYNKELAIKCGGLKIDYVNADIDEGFNKIITSFLLKRVNTKW
jgi:uncharacterized protein (DUF58 family)